MRRADAVVEGAADLVSVEAEHETLVLDMLFRRHHDTVAHPLTVWVARPSDHELTSVAQRHLQQWTLVGCDVALSLALDSTEPRARLEAEEARITFELVGCAGLP